MCVGKHATVFRMAVSCSQEELWNDFLRRLPCSMEDMDLGPKSSTEDMKAILDELNYPITSRMRLMKLLRQGGPAAVREDELRVDDDVQPMEHPMVFHSGDWKLHRKREQPDLPWWQEHREAAPLRNQGHPRGPERVYKEEFRDIMNCLSHAAKAAKWGNIPLVSSARTQHTRTQHTTHTHTTHTHNTHTHNTFSPSIIVFYLLRHGGALQDAKKEAFDRYWYLTGWADEGPYHVRIKLCGLCIAAVTVTVLALQPFVCSDSVARLKRKYENLRAEEKHKIKSSSKTRKRTTGKRRHKSYARKAETQLSDDDADNNPVAKKMAVNE